MTYTLLDHIPFALNLEDLLQTLHIQPDSEDAEAIGQMAQAVQALARPRAVCYVRPIEQRGEDFVELDGVRLTSRVLRINLEPVNRVFVFLATSGAEVAAWAHTVNGFLERFWADTIADLALRAAIDALHAHVHARYNPGPISMMNPGSLDDWPMSQQPALFSIIGEGAEVIGVQLTDSLLMEPVKSVSGVFYASAETFESCQLCPVENCPNRRAPFDAQLYERKYGAT